jgi:hypothetical protein
MFEFLFTLFAAITTHGPMEANYATIFAKHGDHWNGGPSPCLHRIVQPDDNIIAHRTLPCGTVVLLYNPKTGMSTVATVGDHGPYGACTAEGWKRGTKCPKGYWVVKRKRSDPGVWRGGFDLTPRVSRALGHKSFQVIHMVVLKKGMKKQKYVSKRSRPSV